MPATRRNSWLAAIDMHFILSAASPSVSARDGPSSFRPSGDRKKMLVDCRFTPPSELQCHGPSGPSSSQRWQGHAPA